MIVKSDTGTLRISLSAAEKNELTFAVLSDPGLAIADALGIVTAPSDDARAALCAVTKDDVRAILRALTLSVSYCLTREEENAHG